MSLLDIDVVGTIFVVNFIQTVDVIKRVLFCPLLIISVFLESDFQIEKLLVSKMNRMEENQKRKSNSLSETTV